MRHLPNMLSAIRLALVGVFAYFFLEGKYIGAVSVFVFAFFTDILDGSIARANGWESNLGKLLDPLADKLMTVAALVCIYVGKRRPIYLTLFLLMLIKETLMIIGGFVMARNKVVAFSDWPGKLATGFFAVGVTLALLSFTGIEVERWSVAILITGTAISYFALVYYAVRQLPRAFAAHSGAETEK